MTITLEISLYPLQEDYESLVISFIQNLKKHSSIEVVTNAMSTQLKGDYVEVMDILKKELEPICNQDGAISTVIKIVNKPLDIEKGMLEF